MMHNSYRTLSVTVNAFWSEYLARKSIVIWRIKNMCVCVCVEGEEKRIGELFFFVVLSE